MTTTAPQKTGEGAFRRYVRPLLVTNRWPLIAALLLVGISGGAAAMQNVFPKWLFSYVLQPADVALAERWWRLGQLVCAYLFLTAVLRMLFWHCGFRLFTRVREPITCSPSFSGEMRRMSRRTEE